MKYFSLNFGDTTIGPVAYSPENSLLSYELIEGLMDKKEMPYDLIIRKVSEGKKGLIVEDDLDNLEVVWEDFLPNNIGLPLMSEKLKNIIEGNLSGNEDIDWVTCKVWAKDKFKIYYIIRFNTLLDVLDIQKTKYLAGTDLIMIPYFSSDKINQFSVFTIPTSDNLYKISLSLFVNYTIKKLIQKEKLKGVDFSTIKIS